MKTNLQLERALFDLNRGHHVILSDDENRSNILFSATEIINENTLDFHKKFSNSFPSIILSPERCKKLNIETDFCCSLTLDENWTIDRILNLAFGKTLEDDLILNGIIEENKKVMNLGLKILKKGKLLPSGIFSIINPLNSKFHKLALKNNISILNVSELNQTWDNENNSYIEVITRAKLPIKKTKNAEIIIFKSNNEYKEYFSILIGKTTDKHVPDNYVPTVRIHSQCVTGDIFHSLKCDCGEQLNKSLDLMVKNNEGIIIYLPQEGRDIGLTNKIRSYKLQEEGLDTVDANLTLGFRDDERSYEVAVAILKKLNFTKINLITNNPLKVNELRKKGLGVSKLIPLNIKPNKFNHEYLSTKKNKAGHFIN